MTTYRLELRSTAEWQDVRYREYTTSSRKAAAFKDVEKIKFTDSGHHIIPVVSEHLGPRPPVITTLAAHVREHLAAKPKPKRKNTRELARRSALFAAGARRLYEEGNMKGDMWLFELWHHLNDVAALGTSQPDHSASSGES